MKLITQTLIIVMINCLIVSCNKDERQATNSVEGIWNITAITTIEGEFTNGTFVSTSQETETGQLGIFNFIEEAVDYNFTRMDSTYVGNATWFLMTEKVNSGFTRVNEHTLTITDNFIFDVTFEDDTKNAEKNATKMTFIKDATIDDVVWMSLTLEKE